MILLSAIPLDMIFAHVGYEDNEDILFSFGTDEFQYAYFETKATTGTGTTFRTIGWNLKFRGNSSSPWHEVCVNVDPDASKDIKYKLYLSHEGYINNKVRDTNNGLKSYCIKDCVSSSNMDAYREVQYYGGEWQFNAIIQVYVNGVPQDGKTADNFDDAIKLASWSTTTKNELHKFYYERPGTSNPEPISKPDFNILYKGSIVNGKTVEKDMEDLKIILQDKSDVPSTSNPIVKRTWYYWDVANGWTQIASTGENDTTVNINNCDNDLLGSKPLKKAFRLDIEDSYGYTYSVSGINYEVSFTVTTGTINVHYTNTDTGSPVYPDDIINNVPFNVARTINPKTAPTGLNLLNFSPQTVTLTVSNPITDVYFLYAPTPPIGEEQSMITVYYKDKRTLQDIRQPDITTGGYGTYQVEAVEISDYTLDSTTPSPVTVTTSASNSKPIVTFLYNSPIPKRPPIAIIDAPEKVYAGDNFYVSGKKSYDPDGSITDYAWDYDNDISGNALGSKDNGYIWFPYGSSGLIKLKVTDNDGATGSDREYVDVLPPVPIAKIDQTGIPKVNRRLTVSALSSIGQDHYPIDHTRDKWTFNGNSTNIKYSGDLTGSTKDFLAKAPGDLSITLQVNNTCTDADHPDGFFDTDSIIIKILPDLKPDAEFSVPSVVTRNPADSNNAKITITNTSISPDGDIIGKAVAMCAYDSDNDGNFEEETWYYSKDGINWLPVRMIYADMVTSFNIFNISSSNPSNFTLKTKKVGKYRFEMQVMEDIPDSQTIRSFLTQSDYMRNDTFSSKPLSEKIVEVKNIAPSVSFQTKKNIPMDLVVLTDYLGYKYDSLVSCINAKEAELLPLGINPAVSYITGRKTVGERTAYQYAHKRFITISVSGTAHDCKGDFPYSNTFTIGIETLNFFEGEENYPDRSKYTYQLNYSIKEEYPFDNGDPTWELYVYRNNFYDGQYQSTSTYKFRLGRGQQFNGLGIWFDQDELDSLKIKISQAYAQTFKKCEQVGSERSTFQGLDADKVMNVNTPSSNRYLLAAADSFWNTLETNKPLKDYISANNISTYLVADNDTLNKVFTLSNFSDIRFINGLRAYEKDGKLYQYSGSILQEISYTPKVYPTPQTSVNIPMQNLTLHRYKDDGEYCYETILEQSYTTTISIVNNSITVNSSVLDNVKYLYNVGGSIYYAELFNGDIYYFKKYPSAYSSGSYYYKNTYLSYPNLVPGAKGIKNLKMVIAQECVDTADIYNPRAYINAEYHYIQDNNNNIYFGKHGGYYDQPFSSLRVDNSAPFSKVASGVLDNNIKKETDTGSYRDHWNNYRTYTYDVVNVEYALTSELSSIIKVDQDVDIYSTKELVPLKNLFDGIKGGIYAADSYQAAIDDIAKDIKSTTSTLTNYYLVNEQINYSAIYSDYEGDAQYASRWMFTHNANYFDNSNGIEPNSGKYITTPISPFTKVGKYEITVQVRDNPQNDDRFDSYRLWSTVTDKLTIYVHRRPVALQRITIANNGNGTFTVKAYDAGSYDPDHDVSRTDKGITEREWRWKEAASTGWTAGQMNKTDCTADKSYITQLRVKDLEGVWSEYNTITLDKDNPPAALFNIEKKIISTAEYLKVKDQSFPQSFCTITDWHWIVNKVNTDGSETNIYTQKANESNTGTGSLAGYDKHVKYSYGTTGKYRVYLRVKDSNGLWSDCGTDSVYSLNSFYNQEFEVDSPPEASFVIEKNSIFIEETLKLKDQSTAKGISPITRWHWIVKKLNQDGSVPNNNIQDAKFTDSNTGTGSMSGYDVNVKTLYADKGAGIYRIYLRVMNGNGMWSDGGTESSYNLNNFFHRDLEVQESFKISNFRVVRIRDLHLEAYYYEDGRYEDRPFYVNDMAIDPSNFMVGGISSVQGFSSLTKGYRFEFEIDTTNFNEENDTIVIAPSFFSYTRGVPGVRGSETDLYWEDSNKNIYKAGEGAHSRWVTITLKSSNRTITGENSATWRGEYLIPATSWQVPLGTSASNAKFSRINADIIVNFRIKGYKDGVMKYDYNLQQWAAERTTEKYPYEIGDVIRYDCTKSSLDDKNTIINRP